MRIECRSELDADHFCVYVTIGCRSVWVQVAIGCRSELNAGQNWAQARSGGGSQMSDSLIGTSREERRRDTQTDTLTEGLTDRLL